jgi:hypothetical protein
MALYNCKCLYDYDKEVLIEALADYAQRFRSRPEIAKRAEELQDYIRKTPDCNRPSAEKQCIKTKMKGKTSDLRQAFLQAATECARPVRPSPEYEPDEPIDIPYSPNGK